MVKNSMSNQDLDTFFAKLEQYSEQNLIPSKFKEILQRFVENYAVELAKHGIPCGQVFLIFLDLIRDQFKNPYTFQPYHEHILSPFDYYHFGLDFVRPLVDMSHSSVSGLEHMTEITSLLAQNENVIFLANHQIEADPQAISLLLENTYPDFARDLIFVAGERVVTDPLAIPFSMGRNLLCIYSKRYIDNPPEDKLKKQLHNKRTMELMSELLGTGGKAIYVAPSGGRDRRNAQGIVEVAPFDPQSIEMFYLMAQRAKRYTHFYPLTLATYDLLPPPQTIQIELGEERTTRRGGIHLAIGPRIDMENFPGSDLTDKYERRKARADHIWNLVHREYVKFA